MKVKINKLYRGHVSVRSQVVNKCINKNQDLIIDHNGQIMTISHYRLVNPKQMTKKEIQSKFNNEKYVLYDFPWRPDCEVECEGQEKLF